MLSLTTETHGTTGRVTLAGRFTFECHKDFKKATDPLLADPALDEIHVHLGGLTHMDASSLGMLLVLREKAALADKSVVLLNPAPCAQSVLETVRFGKVFRIADA